MDKSIFSSFGLRENPFSVNPDPRHLFLTNQTRTTLDALIQGIQSRQGLMLLTGDVGTGKTTLINSLLDWLQQNGVPTAFIFNSHLEVRELFELMLSDFHIPSDVRSTSSTMSQLNAWLLERYRAGETAVLIIDEAQGLPLHTIEEIRLLLNLETPTGKLLQIVLSGQSDLNDRLKRLDLRPLHQRISLRCRTMPMTLEETRGCIQHRIRVAGAQDDELFTPEAMDMAHFYSRGIPRIINLLCEQALLKAYSSGIRPVSAAMIEDASREFQFDGDRPVAPLLRANEAIGSRASVIPMQSMSNPPMSFAAAAGSELDRRQDAKTIRIPPPATKSPLVLTPNNREQDAGVVKKGFGPQADTYSTKGQEAPKRANSGSHRSADAGQIMAELSAGVAANVPTLVNRTAANRGFRLVKVWIRESILGLIRMKTFLLTFVAKSKGELGHRTRKLLLSFRLGYLRWSKRSVELAAPVLKRMASPFISWLKEPRPPKLLVRASSGTQRKPSGRFSAFSNNLRDRAEPVVRWLQTPLRPAHRR
ncbi:MAG TPA: AAA family ATPase [Candidatus Acidoferrales bacterium]|nr:AAA family ATPase [Candidatus Acidoferrales bacterium]